MEQQPVHICWIRRDIRLSDHAALSAATSSSGFTHLLFNFDPELLNKIENKTSFHVQFMLDSLKALDQELQKKTNARLNICFGPPTIEIPNFCKKHGVTDLHFNRDYEPSAIKRDEKIISLLGELDVKTHTYKDHVIFEPSEILKSDGLPYKVFTPYKNSWLKKFRNSDMQEHSDTPKYKVDCNKIKTLTNADTLDKISITKLGFKPLKLGQFQAGSKGAEQLLNEFDISKYNLKRDRPDLEDGTSHLSPHLRFGTLSTRALVKKARSGNGLGYQTWLSELIWREFYQMIIFHFPLAEKHSFNPKYLDLKWPGQSSHLAAWQNGLTGYPIVDAGMRQLKTTGWMHNRVRMIVASFLTKDLLINWQDGESWFREHLIDYELASNNGGWQWAASTGCDAQPYFRIFNPILQSEKFDPEGLYIKKYIPELESFSSKNIHAPWLTPKELQIKCKIGVDYPNPIVDHSAQKIKVLKLFKKI